ncbi:MAG: nucleotidyltransferase domain-containing protein [Hydrogenobaculum sp.]|nr:MAG: hypothetical protein C0170_03415 [Hydrogenobaculum sp.]HEK25752.1 nucleotidyltransferase domain-containing protein [Hydrogenobaculum sp.]
MKKVRLDDEEIKAIKESIKAYDKDAKIFIFGSRADLSKKGGDIDILILSDKIDLDAELSIRAELLIKLGDRKIDIVRAKNPESSPFVSMIYEEAVEI